MAQHLVGAITLEVNGLIMTNCSRVTPGEEIKRQRADTMSGGGFIEVEPDYGITVEILEAEIAAMNGNLEEITNGTITVVYKTGRRTIYPNCKYLSFSHGGYTPKGEATMTYEFMCDRPSKI